MDWTSSPLINIVEHPFHVPEAKAYFFFTKMSVQTSAQLLFGLFLVFLTLNLYELQTNDIYFKPLLLSEPSSWHLNMLWHHPT